MAGLDPAIHAFLQSPQSRCNRPRAEALPFVSKSLTCVTNNVTSPHPAHERAPFARALSKDGAGAVSARGTMHSAPGRLWASRPAALGPRREVLSLDWDRSGRVTPASTRVPGSMAWS